jgi:hypothetical protein
VASSTRRGSVARGRPRGCGVGSSGATSAYCASIRSDGCTGRLAGAGPGRSGESRRRRARRRASRVPRLRGRGSRGPTNRSDAGLAGLRGSPEREDDRRAADVLWLRSRVVAARTHSRARPRTRRPRARAARGRRARAWARPLRRSCPRCRAPPPDAGAGLAQRGGGPVEEIRPGDVVWFEPARSTGTARRPRRRCPTSRSRRRSTAKAVDRMEHVSDAQYAADRAAGALEVWRHRGPGSERQHRLLSPNGRLVRARLPSGRRREVAVGQARNSQVRLPLALP